MTTTINASTSSGLVVTPDNSGVVQLQYNGVAGPAFNAALNSSGSVTVTANNPIIFNQTQFERGGTDALENQHIFQTPEIKKAGGIAALKEAGKPADILKETKVGEGAKGDSFAKMIP